MKMLILALAFASTAAQAACEPSQAVGPVLSQAHLSGALLIAFRCPDQSAVAFAARAEWTPQVPLSTAEVARLLTLHGYDRDPNYLQAEAAKLLASP